MREAALHDWPALRKQWAAPWRIAKGRSQSPNRMLGDFPPNSSVVRAILCAATPAISFPTDVEPVKETMSIRGSATRACPARSSPMIRLKTPAGRSAASTASARRRAVRVDHSEGFSTIEQPAAKAAPSFSTAWFNGQFHGVIRAATPTGS